MQIKKKKPERRHMSKFSTFFTKFKIYLPVISIINLVIMIFSVFLNEYVFFILDKKISMPFMPNILQKDKLLLKLGIFTLIENENMCLSMQIFLCIFVYCLLIFFFSFFKAVFIDPGYLPDPVDFEFNLILQNLEFKENLEFVSYEESESSNFINNSSTSNYILDSNSNNTPNRSNEKNIPLENIEEENKKDENIVDEKNIQNKKETSTKLNYNSKKFTEKNNKLCFNSKSNLINENFENENIIIYNDGNNHADYSDISASLDNSNNNQKSNKKNTSHETENKYKAPLEACENSKITITSNINNMSNENDNEKKENHITGNNELSIVQNASLNFNNFIDENDKSKNSKDLKIKKQNRNDFNEKKNKTEYVFVGNNLNIDYEIPKIFGIDKGRFDQIQKIQKKKKKNDIKSNRSDEFVIIKNNISPLEYRNRYILFETDSNFISPIVNKSKNKSMDKKSFKYSKSKMTKNYKLIDKLKLNKILRKRFFSEKKNGDIEFNLDPRMKKNEDPLENLKNNLVVVKKINSMPNQETYKIRNSEAKNFTSDSSEYQKENDSSSVLINNFDIYSKILKMRNNFIKDFGKIVENGPICATEGVKYRNYLEKYLNFNNFTAYSYSNSYFHSMLYNHDAGFKDNFIDFDQRSHDCLSKDNSPQINHNQKSKNQNLNYNQKKTNKFYYNNYSYTILDIENQEENESRLNKPSSDASKSKKERMSNISRLNKKPKPNIISENFQIFQGVEVGKIPLCTSCLRWKLPRTHHCRSCGKCILKMDHHCPWLANCIGFKNYKFFCLLILYGFFLSLTVFFTFWEVVVNYLYSSETDVISTSIVCLCYSFNFGLLIFLSYLFNYNINLIFSNETIIERSDKERFMDANLNQNNLALNSHFSFDKGYYRNFTEVFGSNPIFWFFPVASDQEYVKSIFDLDLLQN